MSTVRRVLRALVAGGLIPLVLAAGMPLGSCACDTASPAAATCCCCGKPVGEAKDAGCPCCKASGRSKAVGARHAGHPAAGLPGPARSVGCCCGHGRPVPAAPSTPGPETSFDLGLPSPAPRVASSDPAASRVVARLRTACLPVRDLTTLYRALVI